MGALSGFITVAINYRLAPAEIEYIVKDSAPSVLIFDEEYASIAAGIRAKMPEIGKRLSNEGLLPQGTSPAEFEKFIAKEIAKWAKVTKAAGITAQ